MKVVRLVAVVAVLVCAHPALVAAATVSADDEAGRVIAIDAEGEVNQVALEVDEGPEGRTVTFSDSSVAPSAGKGCQSVGQQVSCVLTSPHVSVAIDLGGGVDRLEALADSSSLTLRVHLGKGDDKAVLGPGAAICGTFPCIVHGDQGDDALVASDGNNNELSGEGGDDVLVAGGSTDFSGGGGDDRLRGGVNSDIAVVSDPGDDRVSGGPGNDSLNDTGGADIIRGGPGEDDLQSLASTARTADSLNGGRGFDFFRRYCGSCTISLDGRANDGLSHKSEGDNVAAESILLQRSEPDSDGSTRLLGDGSDLIVGDKGINWLFGQDGPDEIRGRAGADFLAGGSGRDLIRSADGSRDKAVHCGPQRDHAIVDRYDNPENCEFVEVRR